MRPDILALLLDAATRRWLLGGFAIVSILLLRRWLIDALSDHRK